MKRLILSLLFMGSLLIPSLGMAYEYLVIKSGALSSTAKGQTKLVNKYALKGWELHLIGQTEFGTFFYFRR